MLFNTIRREHLFPMPCLMHGLSLLYYGSALSQETCQDFMKELSKNNWRCSVFFSSWEEAGQLSCNSSQSHTVSATEHTSPG